jgi:hypothetical protein
MTTKTLKIKDQTIEEYKSTTVRRVIDPIAMQNYCLEMENDYGIQGPRHQQMAIETAIDFNDSSETKLREFFRQCLVLNEAASTFRNSDVNSVVSYRQVIHDRCGQKVKEQIAMEKVYVELMGKIPAEFASGVDPSALTMLTSGFTPVLTAADVKRMQTLYIHIITGVCDEHGTKLQPNDERYHKVAFMSRQKFRFLHHADLVASRHAEKRSLKVAGRVAKKAKVKVEAEFIIVTESGLRLAYCGSDEHTPNDIKKELASSVRNNKLKVTKTKK